jgi:4-alpha-glucanotransferase
MKGFPFSESDFRNERVNLPRSSGVLLHPTSFPSGRLGSEAYRFVDWLAAAGQSWWQVLPLGPPDEVGSPYFSASAFAGWTGLLAEPDAPVSSSEQEAFLAAHPHWASDWAAFAGADAVGGQVRFAREWGALRKYAAARGVRLIGDLPLYVSDGGADHRSHPELFEEGAVAGVPPDYFSADGQLWGNPLYDWRALRKTGYRWWIERFRRTLELVELTRIDHFRGFVAYWAVPVGAKTARTGRWRRGPSRSVFDAARAELGTLPVIAEDLGLITPPVERLRDDLGFPGMRVLQFAYGDGPRNPHLPENHPENAVVYTGTHDNDTAAGWYESLPAEVRARVPVDPAEPHWGLIGEAMRSRARLAVVPLQDVLGLGSEARMNTPGVEGGNWAWRYEAGALTDVLAEQLRSESKAARRIPR